MNTLKIIFLALAAAAPLACATHPAIDPRPIARDPVCEYYGELGCVSVRVDKSTPSVAFEGKTYYFCSPDCAVKFEKDPSRFLKPR